MSEWMWEWINECICTLWIHLLILFTTIYWGFTVCQTLWWSLGLQSEQDRQAPCFQGAYIIVKDVVNPQETNMCLISDSDSATERIHKVTWNRVSGGAGWLEEKGSREGLSKKVAFELWTTVRVLVFKCSFSLFQELFFFFFGHIAQHVGS